MSTLRRYPLVAYFGLTFAISWITWAPALILSQGSLDSKASAYLHLIGSLGPMTSAIVVTALSGGSAALRELFSRMVRWRVGVAWWIVAVFSPAILFVLSAVIVRVLFGEWPQFGTFGRSEEFAWLGLLPYWIANVVFFGFGEEVGWRGFALPRLQTGRSALLAAVILSILWALWHLPLFSFAGGLKDMGLAQVPGWFFFIVTGSVLLAWVYNDTGGSILIVAFFHATLDIAINSPSGPQLANVLGALFTIWGLFVLVWAGPRNLSRRGRKQESPAVVVGAPSTPRVR